MNTSIYSRALTPLSRRTIPQHTSATTFRPSSTLSGRENQTFSLSDGRILGFAEYGQPAGYPLMFFHGYPMSRLEASTAHKIALRRNLRIISPDRPGYGLSMPQPGRRITDWPADVQALAEHLGLSRFAIIGGSGGGPYAVACAHMLPSQSMSAVGVLAGAPPWEAGTQGVTLSRKLASFFANYWPYGLKAILYGTVRAMQWILALGPVKARINNWLSTRGAFGEGPVEERRQNLMRLLFEGFAQGAGAAVEEARLLTDRNWGFRFEDVAYNKIVIWHGTKDVNAPIRMVRYMATRLPHAVLHEFSEDSHYTIGDRVEAIFEELVPEAKPTQETSTKG